MSLVLAFGLSPLGQVPAYAAPEGDAQAAALQAQDGQNFQFGGFYYKLGTEINAPITYTGARQVLKAYVQDTDGSIISVGDTGAACYTAKLVAPGKKDSEGAPVSMDTSSSKGELTIPVTEAGTYKLIVTGTEEKVTDATTNAEKTYASATPKTYEITVSPLDISGLIFVPVQGQMSFTGVDRDVTYRLAEKNAADATLSGYTQDDIEKANYIDETYANGLKATLNPASDPARDFDASVKVVGDAGTYYPVISAVDGGSCTGSASTSFAVSKVNFLGASAGESATAFARSAGASGGSPVTVASDLNSGTVEVSVAPNNAQSPIELTYGGDADVKLVEKKDYTVTYYQNTNTSGGWTKGDQITGSLPTTGTYIAEIRMSSGSTSFLYKADGADTTQVITAHCQISTSGTIEAFASRVVLPDAVYLGGAAVTITTEGARFYDADGNDVTDAIGNNSEIKNGSTYAIAASNTANTAQLYNQTLATTSATTGISGAGDYTITNGVTGKTAFIGDDGLPATVKVLPRVAKVGTDVGDLKVEVKQLAYNNGDYIDMKGQYSVQMYTAKNAGSPVTVQENSGAARGQMGDQVVNYRVSYYKGDKKVTAPTEMGEYTAVFSFDGNLKGTPDITTTFTVSTGDITTLVKGVKTKASATVMNQGEDDEYTAYTADPELTFTGSALSLDKADLVLVDAKGAEVDPNKLVGTGYELSYERGSASPDAEGNPVDAGSYVLKATFSGNYSGSVEGALDVRQLSLRQINTANNDVAELQFELAPGVWDVDYSALKTGSAIEPAVRVVVKDGKQRSAEPTVVNGAVYAAKFTDNVDAGQAKVALTANSGYGANVLATSAPQNAFVIADKSFDGIGAALKLSKSEVDYKDAIDPITFQVTSSEGPIPYSTAAANADGYVKGDGNATITRSGVEIYQNGTTTTTYGNTPAKTVDGLYDAYTTSNSGFTTKSFAAKNALPNPDGYYIGTLTEEKSGETDATVEDVYCDNLTDLSAANLKVRKASQTFDDVVTASDTDTEVDFTATKATDTVWTYAKGTATITLKNQELYQKGADYYFLTSGTVGSGAVYTKVEDATAVTKFGSVTPVVAGFEPASAAVTAGTNFKVKITDEEGNDVTEAVEATIEAATAPYTTVTIDDLAELGAGKYTVTAYTGTNGQYAGRVSAELTIKAVNIEDSSLYTVIWSSNGTKKYSVSDSWKITYAVDKAKTIEGMRLTDASGSYLTVNDGDLDEYNEATKAGDYKVTYEDNHAAGTAKVVIEGVNNYTGKIEKPFTIERATLKPASLDASGKVVSSGYKVDFVTTSGFKQSAATGQYSTDYTGSEITPDFEVNYYDLKEGGVAGTAGDYEVKYMLEDAYSYQFVNNKDVTYDAILPEAVEGAVLRVTGTGNYKDTLDGLFKINPIDLYNNDAVTVSPVSDQVWTGEQVIPAVDVTLNGNKLVQGTNYVVTLAAGDDGIAEGEHTALIASAGKGNTTVSTPIPVKFNIKKASEITYDLSGATVALSASKFTYNGKAQAPTVTGVTLKDGTLLDAALYTATIPTAKDAKTYEVSVKGATANVTGTATASFTIAKAANTLKVAKATRTAKGVSKAKKAVKGLKVKNAGQGAITYKKVSVNKNAKKFKVNSKTGKITVKKGTKKGSYKVTVKATAKGNSNYAGASKQAVVTVKVKK